MSEETNDQVVATETPAAPSNADFKKTALFDTMTAQVKEARAALAEIKASNAEKAKAERDAGLKAGEQWETLETELRGELATQAAKHAADILNRDLTLELTKQFSDPYFVQAKAGSFDGDAGKVADYVAGLVADENNARYLSTYTAPPTGSPPPGSSTPAARSGTTTLQDRLKSTDPEVKRAAVSEKFQTLLRGESVD